MLLSSYWHLTSQLLNCSTAQLFRLFLSFETRLFVCFFIFRSHFVGVNFFFSEKWHAIPLSRLPRACFIFYNEITLRREIGAHLRHAGMSNIRLQKKKTFSSCAKSELNPSLIHLFKWFVVRLAS